LTRDDKSFVIHRARREHYMGLLGKVVGVKAVKGHREAKEEKKEEAAKKPEEKK
jgi:hypothetical protein